MYTNFFHNLIKFLKNFFKDFQNVGKVFPNIPLFFSKCQQVLLKTNTFSSFSLYFLDSSSVPYWQFIQFFCKFLKIFFKD